MIVTVTVIMILLVYRRKLTGCKFTLRPGQFDTYDMELTVYTEAEHTHPHKKIKLTMHLRTIQTQITAIWPRAVASDIIMISEKLLLQL